RFEVGIEHISGLVEKLVLLHYSRGVNYRHEKNLSAAQRDVSLAEYYVEMLHGGIQDDLGHFNEALNHYQKALIFAEKSNQLRQVGRVQYSMGIVLAKLEQFEEAFDHFRAAIDLFVTIKNKIQEMFARSNYGSTLALAGNYQAGINESLKALAFYEKTRSAYWIALNATTLADTYFDMGNLEEAAHYARKVIEQEEMQFYPYGLYTMGAVRQAQDDLKVAKDLFAQAAQMAENNEDRYMQAYAQRALGEVCCQLGDMASGEQSLQQAYRLFGKMGIGSEIKKTESLMERYSSTA
ncbi:MAG: tetratricopeptide repeat protein, partial [Chloroflexota bacterium]